MKSRNVLCLIFVFIVTTGCATFQAETTLTSVPPTNTLAPTATITATKTATATHTSTLTPTPTLTLTPMPIPDEFMLKPQWHVGETHRFQRIITRSDHLYGMTPQTNSTIDTLAISVLDANEDGYVLEWKLEGVEAFDLEDLEGVDVEAFLADMSEAIQGVRIEYEVDMLGQIVQLSNLDEIRDSYKKIQTAMISGFEEIGMGQEFIDIMPAVWDQLTSDEMLEASALGGPTDYHLLYGLNLETKSPVTYIYSGEKLNDEEALNFEIELKVVDYDPENDQVQVHGDAVLEGEELEKFVQVYVDMILSQTSMAEPDEEFLEEVKAMIREVDYSIEFDLAVEISTGWITAHKKTTQIEMESLTRVETVNMRMLEE